MGIFDGVLGAIGNLVGGITNANTAENVAEANRVQQMFMAQHGLMMKAADARDAEKAYGINPLALLGVPTASWSNTVGDSSLGDSIGRAGQDLGRAVAAATDQPSRADQLNEKLLEAKIANVNADTVRMQAAASAIASKLGQPATANVPFPTPDPRGPVIPLVQRAWDARTNEYVWIPSEKAASPLQTLAASPTNAAMAGRSLSEGLLFGPSSWWSPGPEMQGAAARAASSAQYDPYTPF